MISLISPDTPDTPNKPDSLFNILNTVFISYPRFSIKWSTTDASISPERVAIMTPARGVRPIEVSIDLPSFTAQSEAPAPK